MLKVSDEATGSLGREGEGVAPKVPLKSDD